MCKIIMFNMDLSCGKYKVKYGPFMCTIIKFNIDLLYVRLYGLI